MEAWYPSRHLRHSGVFIVNFEHISHLVLVLLLVTLNMQLPAGMCIILSRVTFQNEQPCFSKKKIKTFSLVPSTHKFVFMEKNIDTQGFSFSLIKRWLDRKQ